MQAQGHTRGEFGAVSCQQSPAIALINKKKNIEEFFKG